MGAEGASDGQSGMSSLATGQSGHAPNLLRSNNSISDGMQPGADGARYYTIQRVNGNGANGKGDGTVGGHRHSMEDSDKIKKNSIHRHFLKEDKERRKSHVSNCSFLQTPTTSYSAQSRGFEKLQAARSTCLYSRMLQLRHRYLPFLQP